MSLTSAMQIGRSALNASQLAIQVAGNNLANAATPGYSRQTGDFVPVAGDRSTPGGTIGQGVAVRSIRRQIDEALQARLMGSNSDRAAAQTQHNILSQVEAALGELGDHDLSGELSAFFRSWSERANQTRSSAAVVQQGDKLAQFIRRLRGDLQNQQTQIDDQLGAAVGRANELLSQIADLNQSISAAEGGGRPANPLRDARDTALTQLAEMMDITVIDRGLGGVDVLVGSAPILQGSRLRELELRRRTDGRETSLSVSVRATASQEGIDLSPSGGQIAALLGGRQTAIRGTIATLDTLASRLIFEVNSLHSTASNAAGLTGTTGTLSIAAADRTRSLADSANASLSPLPFAASHGGFLVRVRHSATGAMEETRIAIDLDGISAAAGGADDTTAESLRAALNAVPGLSATFTPEGKLRIDARSGFDFSFGEDSSGVLAVLGLNSYFTGTGASDIAVRSDLLAQPQHLSVGRYEGGRFVENGAALVLAGLQDQSLAALGGRTISGLWRDGVQAVGGAVSAARTNAEAKLMVHESLEAQRSAVSGVNVDEESISLLDFQRQYQAAARVISTADQMFQTLLTIV